MNELDSLRQEAETLKNAIRVSTLTCFLSSKIGIRIHVEEEDCSIGIIIPIIRDLEQFCVYIYTPHVQGPVLRTG